VGEDKIHRPADATVAAIMRANASFIESIRSCFEPTVAGIRLEAKFRDRQYELDQVLMRCVASESGCWEWQGAKSKRGYGRVKIDGRLVSPHRVTAWAMGLVESLSDPERAACVLHRCDNPKCVRPDHLFVGTLVDNMQDCSRKGRIANQKNPWKPKAPKKAAITEPAPIISKSGKWVLTPASKKLTTTT
jgi:hypothetical protein